MGKCKKWVTVIMSCSVRNSCKVEEKVMTQTASAMAKEFEAEWEVGKKENAICAHSHASFRMHPAPGAFACYR